MRNDLRGVIRGREAYLKQTDVAFKDRAEPQRCTTTEDSNGPSIPGDKRQISLSSPFFRVAVHSGARPREDRSLSEDAQLIMKRSAEGLQLWAFLITPSEDPPPFC